MSKPMTWINQTDLCLIELKLEQLMAWHQFQFNSTQTSNQFCTFMLLLAWFVYLFLSHFSSELYQKQHHSFSEKNSSRCPSAKQWCIVYIANHHSKTKRTWQWRSWLKGKEPDLKITKKSYIPIDNEVNVNPVQISVSQNQNKGF